jgi:peptide/nickel transport system substrate-binding protein
MITSGRGRGTAAAIAIGAAIGLWCTDVLAGGTLKIAREQDNTTFDPILTIQNADIWVMDNMNAGLVRVTKDGLGLEPDLAKEWAISDDAKTYTFKLRDGLKFSDGSPVTASDVKFSLERLRDQKDSVMASMYGIIAAIEAPEEATVVVHLKEPSAPFLSTLAMFAASVVPEKAVKAEGADFATKPVGAGAFKLDEWKRGDRVILVRNHAYWDDSRVKLDGVEWVYIPNDNTRMLKLQAGEVDAAIFVPFNQIDTLQKNPDIQVHLDPSSREDHMLMNHAHEPLGDVQVRRAICMAIDRQAIVKTVAFGHGQVANSIIPAGALYHNDANPTCKYDPDAASKLLAQAGIGDNLELKLLIAAGNSIDEQTAVLIKDMLGKIGMSVNIEKEEQGQQWNSQVAGDYDLSLGYWTNDIIDPDEKITFSLYGKDENKSFFTNYNNPKLTELIDQGRVTMDPAKRTEIYNQIQKIASQDVNWVDLYYSPFRNASRAYVKDFYQNPTGRFMLENTDIVK